VKIVRTWVESFPSFSRRSSEILVGEAAGPVAKRVPVAGRACTGTDLETAVAMGARAETNALEAVRMASWRASRCATPLPDLIIFSRRTGLVYTSNETKTATDFFRWLPWAVESWWGCVDSCSRIRVLDEGPGTWVRQDEGNASDLLRGVDETKVGLKGGSRKRQGGRRKDLN